MTKKNTALPEHVINDKNSTLSVMAAEAIEIREKVNEFSAVQKEKNKKLTIFAEALRSDKISNGDIIGKIIITPPEQPASRVEFNIKNGALDINDLPVLDDLFGSARPDLFEPAEVVDKIIDPDQCIEALKNAGLNPWDYLDIKVKKEQDQIVIDKGNGFSKADAILPRKGFLATLKELMPHFTDNAKSYITKYLEAALNTRVVLGTKV